MEIDRNSKVTFCFTITDEKGVVVEKRPETAPTEYIHGYQQLLPALEKLLKGHKEGETIKETLPPEKCYGAYDAKLVQKVPRSDIPDNETIEKGAVLTAVNDHGHEIKLRVIDVNADGIVLDANHPLAGSTLTFEVKILNLEQAKPEEIEKLPYLN